MGLQDVASGERVHIGFFGLRNAGKSSVVNAIAGQNMALVSDVAGTTTDPVKKAMELLPIGPVLLIDTAGIDDVGTLGEKRVEKTKGILEKTDVAVLVVDAAKGKTELDSAWIELFQKKKLPYIVVYNKADTVTEEKPQEENEIFVSAKTQYHIQELKEKIGALAKKEQKSKLVVGDLLQQGDVVVLVMPIDEAAPKGRIILPQQMVLREILDVGAIGISCQVPELAATLQALKQPPRLVITDSQAFREVHAIVPPEILLTSFSILMARYKGDLETLVSGARAIEHLQDKDKVLISEGCTHHRQCNDIGSVKIPNLIRKYTGKEPSFSFTSGGEFPNQLTEYAAVVHCGGCMLNEKEMKRRLQVATTQGVPIVNYGVLIASINGILERSLAPFEAKPIERETKPQ